MAVIAGNDFGFRQPPESTNVLVAVMNAHGDEVLDQPAPLIAAVPAFWDDSGSRALLRVVGGEFVVGRRLKGSYPLIDFVSPDRS